MFYDLFCIMLQQQFLSKKGLGDEEPIQLVTFKHVKGEEIWLEDNPGQQTIMTGLLQSSRVPQPHTLL